MKVRALNNYTKNKRVKPKVESLEITENSQIRILSANVRDWIDTENIRGLCFSRFNEHIVIETDSDELSAPTVGKVIEIEGIKLEITGVGKGCFSECEREQKHLGCMLRDHCIYAKAVNAGVLEIGMMGHVKE